MFPRVCRLCRKTNLKSGLDCGECMGVTYCSPEHRDQDRQAHQTTGMCKELRFCLAMDSYESKISVCLPSLPSELDGKYWGVSGEISSFLGHDGLEEMAPLDEMQHKFLCERLSAPLTLLHVRMEICPLLHSVFDGTIPCLFKY